MGFCGRALGGGGCFLQMDDYPLLVGGQFCGVDICSKLSPCVGVIAFNCMLMLSSWCGIGLLVPGCSLCMFDVVLVVPLFGHFLL